MLGDRELTDAELEQIRQILESFNGIGTVSEEMRALIEQQWPHLLRQDQVEAGLKKAKKAPPRGSDRGEASLSGSDLEELPPGRYCFRM